jgi:hypothetical protein
MSLADAAIDAGRRSGDPTALVTALALGAGAISAPWTLEQRTAWATDGSEIVEDLGDTIVGFYVNMSRANNALEQGDLAAMRRHRARADAVAERIPHASLRWNAAFSAVIPLVVAGDLGEAERQADGALALALETGQAEPMSIYAGQIVNIRHHQGRVGELIPFIEQAVVDSPGLPVYRAVLSHVHARHGDRRRAATLLEGDRRAGFAMPADGTWTTAFAEWAGAAVELGDVESASLLHPRLAPFHEQVVSTGVTVLPAVAHHVGRLDHLLGRHDDADRWFAEAMTIHQRLESPLFVAYTQAAWAALLADRGAPGDHERARALAEEALATATSGDYRTIAADARRVLGRLGASAPG